jgi:hypothetical protein
MMLGLAGRCGLDAQASAALVRGAEIAARCGRRRLSRFKLSAFTDCQQIVRMMWPF